MKKREKLNVLVEIEIEKMRDFIFKKKNYENKFDYRYIIVLNNNDV